MRNVFALYKSHALQDSQDPFYANGTAPFYGCLASVTMDPYAFKMLVPAEQFVAVPPTLTKFAPGHDARLLAEPGAANATTVDVRLEFNVPMDCGGVTSALALNASTSGLSASAPAITNVQCGALPNPDPALLSGAGTSAWSWNATLTGVPDGILVLTLHHAPAAGGSGGATAHATT